MKKNIKLIIIILIIFFLIFLGIIITDKIIKNNNYENICKELLTDMDACFENHKCQAISYCPKYTQAKTACCPKGLLS